MSLRIGVVRFPGTNCETETVRALQQSIVGACVELVGHQQIDVGDHDAIVLPGGFSYGDYLRAGAIATRAPVGAAIRRFARAGGVVLGICNGFQQLQELGLLPGALIRNHNLRFFCGMVHLRPAGRRSAATWLLDPVAVYRLPIAHGEGCFWAEDDELKRLEDRGQIVLRYCTPDGRLSDRANPNGSLGLVAGVCNEQGNVVGMMPHPERNAEPLQGNGDGATLFQSLAAFCREVVS
jgi:phosphoribosylformylglycinamidine synthase I